MIKPKTKKNLFLNTAISGEVMVGIFDEAGLVKKKSAGKSDKLLAMVDKIMKNKKIAPKDLYGIAVVSGPGSFTAVRQGIVAANMLGSLFRIPVVGIRLDEFGNDDELMTISRAKMKKAVPASRAAPFYGGEPNITKSKH